MTDARHGTNPPAWAEALLRLILPPAHRDSVSGDLLEEYRDRVFPARGRSGADAWYVRQTLGFVWRATWRWGALLAAAVLIRDAFDRFDPPQSYYLRSTITTYTAIGCFMLAGFRSGRRSNSIVAGAVTGLAVGVIAAALEVLGSAAMLGLSHAPSTLEAIARSGGLQEAFTLPVFVILPGTILATVGGVFGKATAGGERIDFV